MIKIYEKRSDLKIDPVVLSDHDNVIKWQHFPRYWPFVREIHLSPVKSPQKCQWRGALMFSLICAWISVWVNNREACDLRRHRVYYDVTVMIVRPNELCFVVLYKLLTQFMVIRWGFAITQSVFTHHYLQRIQRISNRVQNRTAILQVTSH